MGFHIRRYRAGLIGLWAVFASQSEVERRLATLSAAGLPVTARNTNDYYAVPDGVVDLTVLWISAIILCRANCILA